ncbi:MAG TPA: hypothetical protein PK760_01490 [Flavobacteriales bacterium]|nr:hypothetical protein [Flavobacteriales bacterium]
MKVTFDSNTWRKVASPANFPKEPTITDYQKIRAAIDNGRVEAYLSETIFTLEAIQHVDRKSFFGNSGLKRSAEEVTVEGDTTHIGLTLSRDSTNDPRNTGYLERHFKDASEAGFEIIHLPRIAGVGNVDVNPYRVQLTGTALSNYLGLVFKVGRRIEQLKAGFFVVREIAKKYDPSALKGLGLAPSTEDDAIIKAVAEWADGDSIASHIAIGGDFFCTMDKAKSGGSASVFSTANLATLHAEFGLVVVTPTELAAKL